MPAKSQQPPHRSRRRTQLVLTGAASLATVGALVAALPTTASAHENKHKGNHGHSRYQDVQLLSFNDLHGNLEPPSGSSGRVTHLNEDGTTQTINAGGVEYLATHLREARKSSKYSITAAAGDMVDGHQKPVGLHELEEDLLEDVLGVPGVRDPAPYEPSQPRLLARDHVDNRLIRVQCHRGQAGVVHLPLKTNEGREYCWVPGYLRRFVPVPAGAAG